MKIIKPLVAAIAVFLLALCASGIAEEFLWDGNQFVSVQRSISHSQSVQQTYTSTQGGMVSGTRAWNTIPEWMVSAYGVTSLFDAGMTQDPRGKMIPAVRASYRDDPVTTNDGLPPEMTEDLAAKTGAVGLIVYGLITGNEQFLAPKITVSGALSQNNKLLLPIQGQDAITGAKVNIETGKMIYLPDFRARLKNSEYVNITLPGQTQPETGLSITYIDDPSTQEEEWIPAFVIAS